VAESFRIYPMLAFTDADQWRLGIGDPTFMGWFTVFAYFTAAFLSLAVFIRSRDRNVDARFWAGMLCALLLLGVNKQLDLQTWFTLTARKLARMEGWYEYRRPLQVVFIFLIACGGVFTVYAFWKLAGTSWRKHRLALSGLIFLCVFVVIRAASFHHVDLFLKYDIGGMRMNWLFELGGISLVIAGALAALRVKGQASPGRQFAPLSTSRPKTNTSL
jgi:hypothetical protein